MTTKPQSTTEPLEPCRFCGKESKDHWDGPYVHVSGAPGTLQFYSIVCNGCCSTASYENKERAIAKWNTRLSPASAEPVVDDNAIQECAREISDLIWGEAKKLAQSFVDANIRNYNDHKGVESLERVYDAKRDTAQQIVNQIHNFREARWRKPKDVEAIISKHFAATTAAPVEQSENESCSHWREGDSDNCVWCGDDLGPTTETDVNEGAR